jgi:hypothetical protein
MVKLRGAAVALSLAVTGPAAAQAPAPPPSDGGDHETAPEPIVFPYGEPPDGEWPEGEVPIPPEVQEEPVRGPGNGYCYVGSHPVNTPIAPGATWHDAGGEHTHFYPPMDLRLFVRHGRCYFFVGDPVDFGYAGATFAYHGAHPVAPAQGGGWCFMIGTHGHAWGPWSANFRVKGGVLWWPGPYDGYFATYWPYYAYFYRDDYPRYYGEGAWRRAQGGHIAPPIGRVPSPPPAPGLPPISGSLAAPGPAGRRPERQSPHRAAAFDPVPRGVGAGAPPAPGVASPPPAPALPSAAAASPTGQQRAPRASSRPASGAASPGGAVHRGAGLSGRGGANYGGPAAAPAPKSTRR